MKCRMRTDMAAKRSSNPECDGLNASKHIERL